MPVWIERDGPAVVRFFSDSVKACPGLALTIYETMRAKKALTVEEHRAVADNTGCYLAVKANENTVGCTPEGCRQLSEFVNVWVPAAPSAAPAPCSTPTLASPG